jgi:hypothetical protein
MRHILIILVILTLFALPCDCLFRSAAARAPTQALADPAWCDQDGDGFCFEPFGPDCDDSDPRTYPGAEERDDLKDNNRSGFGDEPPVGFRREGTVRSRPGTKDGKRCGLPIFFRSSSVSYPNA